MIDPVFGIETILSRHGIRYLVTNDKFSTTIYLNYHGSVYGYLDKIVVFDSCISVTSYDVSLADIEELAKAIVKECGDESIRRS